MGKLGIRGHYTRSDEVIKLLESLGGVNENNLIGYKEDAIYVINNKRIEFRDGKEEVIVFTIDEFFEKFPYKIGDKVCYIPLSYNYTIIGMRWIDKLNEVYYKLSEGDGLELVDVSVKQLSNCKKEGKEEIMEERKYADLRLDVDQDDKLATEVTIDGGKITPPENYLIGKITKVDDGMLVEFVKKQPQYPRTYKECCKALDFKEENISFYTHSTISDIKFKNLYKLYVCRNAYWKIVDYKGPEAGTEFCWIYYDIYNREIKMEKGKPNCSMFMSFPDEYVADKFIKYFGDLLEDCKEFL